MTYKIYIKHRIAWSKGNYEAIIRGNKVTMTYEKPRVAASTFKVIEKANRERVISQYDGHCVITEIYMGLTEKEIYDITIEQLDSAIKAKVPLQKISYVVTNL
jgi:hypothetical protein